MRAATGDSVAVKLCIERFTPLVLLLARQTLADRSLIEDAVQDVFIEIWRSAGRYDPKIASARAFVAMIARRRLIDRGRYEQVRIRGVAPLAAAEGKPQEAEAFTVAALDDARRAKELIETMGEPQRQVVKLSLGHGMSHSQIAAALQLPLGSVKTHMRTALQSLRAALGATVTARNVAGPNQGAVQ